MNSATPRVSLGMPAYNGEGFLAKAVDSILAQTFSDLELIICDNASTDRTQEICEAYAAKDSRVKYFRNDQNLGASRNFNLTFEHAKGEYFKWAACDDVLHPEFVAKCVEALDQNPEVIVCYADTGCIDSAGELVGMYEFELRQHSKNPVERFDDLATRDDIWVTVFGLIRSNLLAKTPLIGHYTSSDVNLLAELGLLGEFHGIPETLFFRRDHEEASTRAFKKTQSRLVWFDSKKAGSIDFPFWKSHLEYAHSVNRHPLAFSVRMQCHKVIARKFWRDRRVALQDLSVAADQALYRLPNPIRKTLRPILRILWRPIRGIVNFPLRNLFKKSENSRAL